MTKTLLAAACGLLCLPLLIGIGPSAAQDTKSKSDQTSKKKTTNTEAATDAPATDTPQKDLPQLPRGHASERRPERAGCKKVSCRFGRGCG